MQYIRISIVIGLAAIVSACNRPLDYISEGALQPPACGYEQATDASRKAAEAYYSARDKRPAPDAESDALVADLRYRKEAAERAQQYAKECEDHAREWSDLRAQWQNSRAAINVAMFTDNQITLTVVELVLLIATVVGGFFSIHLSRKAMENSEIERNRQEGQFKDELEAAYTGMAESRRVAEQQSRAYVLPIEAKFDWPTGGRPTFTIIYKNAGETPAIDVSECVLLFGDARPPPFDHHRRFTEKPIVGKDTVIATTKISESLEAALPNSRAIGRRISDGSDVWAYIFYQDVYGTKFRTGAQLSGDVQFNEGTSCDLSIFFNDETCGFFEELDADGRLVQQP